MSKVIIVGGGKLGYFLAQNLLDRDYKVRLIEKDKLRCSKIANDLDVEIIHGDGTKIEVLASAGAGKADFLVAVTGKDQDNLVAAQLAKKKFLIKKVITRANNPRNLLALRELGADNSVSSTEIITKMIEHEIESAGMQLLTTLNKGQASICSVTIPYGAKVSGMTLKDVVMPESSLIVSILRNDDLIIPKGDTTIEDGDEVIVISENQKAILKMFNAIKR